MSYLLMLSHYLGEIFFSYRNYFNKQLRVIMLSIFFMSVNNEPASRLGIFTKVTGLIQCVFSVLLWVDGRGFAQEFVCVVDEFCRKC